MEYQNVLRPTAGAPIVLNKTLWTTIKAAVRQNKTYSRQTKLLVSIKKFFAAQRKLWLELGKPFGDNCRSCSLLRRTVKHPLHTKFVDTAAEVVAPKHVL